MEQPSTHSAIPAPPPAQPQKKKVKGKGKRKGKDGDEEEETLHPGSEAAKLIRRSTKPATTHVFYDITTGLYTSLEAEFLPHPPPANDKLRNIFHALKTRWAYDDMFYLAFIPVQPTYDLPMLDCLSPMAFKVETATTNDVRCFRMEKQLCDRWKSLENVVVRLQQKLLSRIAGTYLLTLSPPFPSSYGYASDWPTEEKATLAARLARTAFTMRFAFLSYLILKESMKGRNTWRELVCQGDEPVPLSICNAIRASWVCDFTIPRIGAFVDIGGRINQEGGRQWHEEIDDMLLAGIPLWFGYAHKPTYARDVSAVTKLEFDRHMPTIESWMALRNVTERAYTTDNENFHAAQRHDNPNAIVTADVTKADYYGYLVQVNDTTDPPDPLTRAFVRRRSGRTSAYDITFMDGNCYDRDADVAGKTHQQLELSTKFFRYRQRGNETYDTFVLRESSLRLYMLGQASGDEKRRILAREERNRDQPVPTGRGPAVYVWQLQGGIQFRRRVHTGRIRDLWDRTTPEQRTYNSMRDEYDVDDTARDLLDPEPSLLTDTAANDNWITESHTRSRSASPDSRPLATRRSRSPIRKLNDSSGRSTDNRTLSHTTMEENDNYSAGIHDGMVDMANTLLGYTGRSVTIREMLVDVHTDDINDLLKYRYGYTAPTAVWQAQEKEAIEWASKGWDKLYRALGQRNKDPDTPASNEDANATSLHVLPTPVPALPSTREIPSLELPAVADFVAAFKRNTTIRELSDLDAKSPLSYANPAYRTLSSLKYQESSTTSSGDQTTTWYMLDKLEDIQLETSRRCRLSTKRAMNVLQSKRAGFGRSAEQIALSMLTRGMTLRLSLPVSTPIATSNRTKRYTTVGSHAAGVGIKPHGVKLSKLDYKTYMAMRDELLAGPAGEAALLSGGILWRLAINVRKIEDVIRGPDTDDVSEDSRIREVTILGKTFAETTLTEQDKYVIVGVYRVLLDGIERSTKQADASITSWWPTPEAWENSGFNTGYWTSEAEFWYRKRVRAIEDGTAVPYTAQEWRSHLRHTKSDSHKFIEHVEAHSIQ